MTPSPYKGKPPETLFEANGLYQRYCDGEITLPEGIIQECIRIQMKYTEPIPPALKDCRFIKVARGKKNAIESDWENTRNYDINDSVIVEYIRNHVNYGVMPLGGVCQIDVDDVGVFENFNILEQIGSTFTVRTGRESTGYHAYLICPDAPHEKIILYDPDTGGAIGDFRGSGHKSYLVGPGSIHPDTGREYTVVNSVPLREITWGDLKNILNPVFKKEGTGGTTVAHGHNPPFAMPDTLTPNNRTNTLFAAARSMAMKGFSVESTIGALLSENQRVCKPPLPDEKVIETAKGAYNPRYEVKQDLVGTKSVPGSGDPELSKLAEKVSRFIPKKKEKGVVVEWTPVIDRQKVVMHIVDTYNPVSHGGHVWLYKDGVYKKENGEIDALVTVVARELDMQAQTSDIREITSMLLGTNYYDESPFNRLVDRVPFRNGYVIIDYENKSVEGPFPHKPENYFTYILPIDYNPNASKEDVKRVLREWVDEDMVDALIQIPAQGMLQGMMDVPFKKSYLLQGEKNSGKSTFLIDLLAKKFFDKSDSALSMVSLQDMTTNRFALTALENVVLNVFDELDSDELNRWGVFKKLVGSTLHEIEEKNKPHRLARIFCVNAFACNNPPEVPDKAKFDPAYWDRWIFVHFPNTKEIDTTWVDKTLTDEFMSGFALLVLDMIIEIHNKKNLIVVQDYEYVMERWLLTGDPLCQFIEEHTSPVDDYLKPIKTLNQFDKEKMYEAYKESCKKNHVDKRKIITSLEKFSRDIQQYGFIPKQVTVKSKEKDKNDKYPSTRVWCYVAYRSWVSDGFIGPDYPQKKIN